MFIPIEEKGHSIFMKYFTFLKRIITFKKYPLFRTVNFRQLLLNIFIISLLVALPNIIALFQTVQATSEIASIESEVPDFEIINGEYIGKTDTISINDRKILFTEDYKTNDMPGIEEDVFLGFLKDGIYIKDVQDSGLDYSYIGQVSNDEELKTFIDQQTSSLYFYVMVYSVLYLALIIFFTVLLMSAVNYLLHFSAVAAKKKSRFMNWFKISSFITVIMLIPITILTIFSGMSLWWLYFLSLPFYFHYFRKLPVMKT